MHTRDMPTGPQIKKTREFLRESQAVFGERFGVDQSTVHRWETDGVPKRGPARMAIQRILDEVRADAQRAGGAR